MNCLNEYYFAKNIAVLIKNFTDKLFLGQCFVPISDIQHLLTFQFKSLLTQNIALTAKILPNLDEDDRLIRMLSELDKRYTGADYTLDKNSKDTIKPEQIKPLKGQAHHMFSRILKLLIFDFFTKFSFTCFSTR